MEQEYNDYIERYTHLTTDEKRKELLKSVKEMIVSLKQLAIVKGKDVDFLVNREMIDLKASVVSEDDYLEGVFAYIVSLEELVGTILLDDNE